MRAPRPAARKRPAARAPHERARRSSLRQRQRSKTTKPMRAEMTPSAACALTRARRPKDELIRFVLGPDGTIVPDLKEKLPGRGVWLTAAHDTCRRRGQTQRLRPGVQGRGQGSRRACGPGRPAPRRGGALARFPSPTRPARPCSAMPRSRKPSPKAGCSPSSMPRRRPTTDAASLTAKPAEWGTEARFRRSAPSARMNWVWHQGGQM